MTEKSINDLASASFALIGTILAFGSLSSPHAEEMKPDPQALQTCYFDKAKTYASRTCMEPGNLWEALVGSCGWADFQPPTDGPFEYMTAATWREWQDNWMKKVLRPEVMKVIVDTQIATGKCN